MKAKWLLPAGALILAAWMLGVARTHSQETAKQTRKGVGIVSSITLPSNTIVVEVPVGRGARLTVGAEVTNKTEIISGGQYLALKDLKPGDTVAITWTRLENKLVADSIVIQGRP